MIGVTYEMNLLVSSDIIYLILIFCFEEKGKKMTGNIGSENIEKIV